MSKAILDYLTKLTDQLTTEERQQLIAHLSKSPSSHSALTTLDLYGAWRDKFPEDADIDAALTEMRNAWQSEWSEGEFRG